MTIIKKPFTRDVEIMTGHSNGICCGGCCEYKDPSCGHDGSTVYLCELFREPLLFSAENTDQTKRRDQCVQSFGFGDEE